MQNLCRRLSRLWLNHLWLNRIRYHHHHLMHLIQRL
jgi:hypothetical protein